MAAVDERIDRRLTSIENELAECRAMAQEMLADTAELRALTTKALAEAGLDDNDDER